MPWYQSKHVDSFPPSAAYMCQMNWVSIGSASSHYLNQCWLIVNWTLRNKLQWNSNQNTILFIHANEFENVVYEMAAILFRRRWVDSLGPSDTIWHWRSWSTLVQLMACCLTAPSHYLNQCWLIISKVLWHSSEDIIMRRFEDTNQ